MQDNNIYNNARKDSSIEQIYTCDGKLLFVNIVDITNNLVKNPDFRKVLVIQLNLTKLSHIGICYIEEGNELLSYQTIRTK